MYINKLIKKQVILSVITLAMISFVVLGSSHALFKATASSPDPQTMNIGELIVSFSNASGVALSDDDAINITDMDPMPDDTAMAADKTDNLYTFVISNTGSVNYTYTIKLEDNESYLPGGTNNLDSSITLLDHNYIRYSLNNESALMLGTDVTNGIIKVNTIAPGETHTYTLKLWVADAEIYQLPNEVLGSEIHLNIKIVGEAGDEAITDIDNDSFFEEVVPIIDPFLNAPAGTLLYAIRTDSNNVVNDSTKTLTTPGQETATENEGLRSTSDDYGTSYYFRGEVENNYVEFANKCWRIVRITGNGAIKLVIYNDNPNNVADPCEEEGGDLAFSRFDETDRTLYSSMFNEEFDNNAYVGLMYGDINGTTYEEVHANNNDSTILTNLKAWYDLSFTDNQKSMLADVIYCNDKSIVEFDGILGDGVGINFTYYGAMGRLYPEWSVENVNPSLICPNTRSDGKLSKFTASDTVNGNGKLRGVNGVGTNEYKVGLLTPDEVAFAGSIFGESNNYYYLFKNTGDYGGWWLSAAGVFDGGVASECFVNFGALYCINVVNEIGLRGVVSLKSNTAVSGGTGTYDDPFVVNG